MQCRARIRITGLIATLMTLAIAGCGASGKHVVSPAASKANYERVTPAVTERRIYRLHKLPQEPTPGKGCNR